MRITTPAGTTITLIKHEDDTLVAMHTPGDDMPEITGYLREGCYAPTETISAYGPHVLRAIADLIEETQK
ncbi:hypothetical protein ACTXMZ_15575 [Brachybacterium alimentarium]|uniref:hypothetical protein n=1 Tax=Brachybacterium alimentarium TaxID=47845 RepID=UPI003FD3FCA7